MKFPPGDSELLTSLVKLSQNIFRTLVICYFHSIITKMFIYTLENVYWSRNSSNWFFWLSSQSSGKCALDLVRMGFKIYRNYCSVLLIYFSFWVWALIFWFSSRSHIFYELHFDDKPYFVLGFWKIYWKI